MSHFYDLLVRGIRFRNSALPAITSKGPFFSRLKYLATNKAPEEYNWARMLLRRRISEESPLTLDKISDDELVLDVPNKSLVYAVSDACSRRLYKLDLTTIISELVEEKKH